MRPTRSAFTLVELSIVLVILGLLVGGVLAGQSLIRSAELRNIGTEKDKLTTAFNAFRDKYFAIPGDMANGYAFWSTSGIAGCTINSTIRDGGCNGNGDLILTSSGSADESVEYIKAPMHLGLAGLVEGVPDGMTDTLLETNTIKSKFPHAYWVMYNCNNSGDPAGNSGSSNPTDVCIRFTHVDSVNFGGSAIASLTHGEAWSVDTKIDDGKANTGKLRGDDDEDCYDQDTDGNVANGDEDLYGITAVGADFAGDCQLYYFIKK